MGDKSRSCMCSKRRQKLLAEKRKERCKRLRQTLVYSQQEEEFYYEPYMQHLREEFSPPSSSECVSGIELPWKEFAISLAELAKMDNEKKTEEKSEEVEQENTELEPVKKESSGLLHLPWEDLVITDTVQSELAKQGLDNCDSSLEIPWEDIMFDSRIKIDVSDEESKKCEEDMIEIPWKDLLVPDNIVFPPRKKCSPFCHKKVKKKNKKCGCSKSKK